MKGYAKFNVTQENRDKLKEWLNVRDIVINDPKYIEKNAPFVEEKFLWYKSGYYDVTKLKLPSGLFEFDGEILQSGLYDDICGLLELIKSTDEVFLGECYAKLFNRYCE